MRDRTRGFYETVVTSAVNDIASNLDSALDLGALAAKAATSSFHFHRIFRGMVDETPLALSRRLRLERAAYWLARMPPTGSSAHHSRVRRLPRP